MPLVSVVLPVYNGEKFLKESIESVLKQTHENFELIIVDDASSDATPEIIGQFRDKRIVTLRNDKNIGVSKALNKGLKAAKGKYIARQDADDVSAKTRLEKQVEVLEKNSKIGVLGTLIRAVDERGNRLKFELPLGHDQIVWRLFFGTALAHPTIMTRTKVLKNAGGYRGKYNDAEDLDLWMRIVGKTKFGCVGEELVTYRSHPDSVSRKRTGRQYELANGIRIEKMSKVINQEVNPEEYKALARWMLGQNPTGVNKETMGLMLELWAGLIKRDWIEANDGSLAKILAEKLTEKQALPQKSRLAGILGW